MAKVQHCACAISDVQLADVVVYTVDEEVDGRDAAGQEGAPPPVIVLT